VLHSGYKYMRHVVDEYVDPNKKEHLWRLCATPENTM
jgi:hypothetical protein